MGIIVIAPELGIALAFNERWNAKALCDKLGEGWTMTHAFYVNMGGVILRRSISPQKLWTLGMHKIRQEIHPQESNVPHIIPPPADSPHKRPKIKPASLARELLGRETSSTRIPGDAPDEWIRLDRHLISTVLRVFLISFIRCSGS